MPTTRKQREKDLKKRVEALRRDAIRNRHYDMDEHSAVAAERLAIREEALADIELNIEGLEARVAHLEQALLG